jgi:carboxyl-terminal processing protease
MKRRNLFLITVILIFIFSSCEESLIEEEFKNTPIDNYNAFWLEFNRFYGAFEAKNINWDSLKTVYAKDLTDSSTNKQLFNSLSGLLNELNDGHADLYAPGIGYYRSWNRRNKSYFGDLKNYDNSNIVTLQNVIKKNYLNDKFKMGEFSGWRFFYGTINFDGHKVGYICIPTFAIDDYPNDFIQQAIDSFNQQDAVIIDLRYNGGGRTEAFVNSLNSFSSVKKLYMKSKFRNGPDHSDFTELDDHYTNPHVNCLVNKPIAILMNAYSASSSDHFILGIKSQPNVVTVGDSTCGAFSSVLERMLPNGWKFRLGAQVVYSPDGSLLIDSKGNYLEGIGIAPDIYVQDKLKEIRKGKDIPLDLALKNLAGRMNWMID